MSHLTSTLDVLTATFLLLGGIAAGFTLLGVVVGVLEKILQRKEK